MNNTYFILRHGETPYQVDKRNIIYPWPELSPIRLTERGRKQVKNSAEKLKKENIDFIFSSDITRTRETAGIVEKEIGIEPIFDIRLREINQGVYQGNPKDDYRSFFANPKEKFLKVPPQGESLKEVRDRMVDFLRDIDKKHVNKKILIVSHGGPLKFLEVAIGGLGEEEFVEGRYKNFPMLKTGELKQLKE